SLSMPSLIMIVAVLIVLTVAYQLGFRRSLAMARGNGRALHSRPGFHGAYVLLWCAVPAIIVAILWFALQPTIVSALAGNAMPPEVGAMPEARQGLELTKIRNAIEALHAGRELSASLAPYVAEAARHYVEVEQVASTSFLIVLAAAAFGGLAFAGSR